MLLPYTGSINPEYLVYSARNHTVIRLKKQDK
jgi:hypothetical protein